jgi:hypothetical protein
LKGLISLEIDTEKTARETESPVLFCSAILLQWARFDLSYFLLGVAKGNKPECPAWENLVTQAVLQASGEGDHQLPLSEPVVPEKTPHPSILPPSP